MNPLPAAATSAYLKPKDIAARYKVSPRTVLNWVHRGTLPAIRTGKIIRVKLQDAIDAFERTPAA